MLGCSSTCCSSLRALGESLWPEGASLAGKEEEQRMGTPFLELATARCQSIFCSTQPNSGCTSMKISALTLSPSPHEALRRVQNEELEISGALITKSPCRSPAAHLPCACAHKDAVPRGFWVPCRCHRGVWTCSRFLNDCGASSERRSESVKSAGIPKFI